MNKFITTELDGGTPIAISVAAIESFAQASDKSKTKIQAAGGRWYLVNARCVCVKDAIERSQHSTKVYHAV